LGAGPLTYAGPAHHLSPARLPPCSDPDGRYRCSTAAVLAGPARRPYISAPVGSPVRPNPNALLPPRSDPPPPRSSPSPTQPWPLGRGRRGHCPPFASPTSPAAPSSAATSPHVVGSRQEALLRSPCVVPFFGSPPAISVAHACTVPPSSPLNGDAPCELPPDLPCSLLAVLVVVG
jgi:hypothetical protein